MTNVISFFLKKNPVVPVSSKNAEKEGQGIKKEGGHDSSALGDPKSMCQVSVCPTDAVVHNNYIVNGHFLVCHTQQSFSCGRSTSSNSQQAQFCCWEMLSLPESIESLGKGPLRNSCQPADDWLSDIVSLSEMLIGQLQVTQRD